MAETLSIQSVTRGTIAYVRVYGVIDESFNPDKLVAAAEGKDVLINLKAVSRISSFGVREWVHAITKLAAKVSNIYFVECSPSIVAQLNMIANFAGPGQVVSVQVPMICESCNWDTEMLVDMSKYTAGTLPSLACKRCSSPMVIDDLPEQYFAFANKTQGPIDPSVQAFLRDFEGALPNEGTPTQPSPPPQSPPPPATTAPPPPPPAAVTQPPAQPPPTASPPRPTPNEGSPTPMPTSIATPAAAAAAMAPPPSSKPKSASDLSDRELSFTKDGSKRWILAVVMAIAGAIGAWLLFYEPSPPPKLPNATNEPKKKEPASQPAASQPASQPVVAKVDGAAEAKKALDAFAAKDYATAIKSGVLAKENGQSDPALLIALGDAYRLTKDSANAAAAYAEVEAALKPKDKRLDDVLFNHAELLAAGDDPTAAKPLYDRLLKEFPKSAHKKAAKAKSAKLKPAKKKKK